MDKLKQKINRLEANIETDRMALERETTLLKQKLTSGTVITLTLLSGFAVGFVLGSPKSRKLIKDKIKTSPGIFKALYKNLHVVVPLITSKFL